MWNCIECGCRFIAASLLSCPMCGIENPEGKVNEMPKATTAGSSSFYERVIEDVEEVVEGVFHHREDEEKSAEETVETPVTVQEPVVATPGANGEADHVVAVTDPPVGS